MKKDTKFKPGQSGNPGGRPKGKTTAQKVRDMIGANDLKEIIGVLMVSAKNGDTAAAKLLLERACPALKPTALPVNVEYAPAALAEQGGNVIKATMSGDIPPDIGSQLITALANQAKIVEIDELTKRVEALERKE